MVTQGQSAREGRRYESPLRVEQAAQTRALILDAARRLFSERGWAATGMRDVAEGAGVAIKTVYANFGSKADLLLAAMENAVVGDDLPVPLLDRAEFAELGRGPLTQRAGAAARLGRVINERTRGLGKALRDAAAGDADLARRLSAGEEQRRITIAEGLRMIAGRPVTDTERDGVWAVLSLEVYELLVDRSGWDPARYEQWLADTIVRLIRPTRDRSVRATS